MIESAHLRVHQLLPILFIQTREERLELRLQILFFDHLEEGIVVQYVLASRHSVVWRLRRAGTVAVLLVIMKPSDKEISEVPKDVPVQLFKCPVLPGPNDSRQVELLHTLEAVNNNFDPISANAHI